MIDTKELRAVIQEIGLNGVCPAEINELLDRLEAAEKEVAHIKEAEFPRKMRAVAVGWEKKCARLEQERDALRARIEEMGRQEPVGQIQRANSTGNYIYPDVWVPLPVGSKLYAAPGAKGEEK